jgi:quercetin dioxygenase-like cupin family protein
VIKIVRREYKEASFTNVRGGKGTYRLKQILLQEEMLGHGRGFSIATLPPGCSIGWHRHVDEYDAYYVLSGEALYTDEDGTKTVMKSGDMSNIGIGNCHAIENISKDADLQVMFLIIYGEGKTEGYAEDGIPLKG